MDINNEIINEFKKLKIQISNEIDMEINKKDPFIKN